MYFSVMKFIYLCKITQLMSLNEVTVNPRPEHVQQTETPSKTDFWGLFTKNDDGNLVSVQALMDSSKYAEHSIQYKIIPLV